MSVKLRGWGEFFETARFTLPPGLSELVRSNKDMAANFKDLARGGSGNGLRRLATRIESNLIYFQVNYLVIVLLSFLYASIHEPMILVALVIGAGMIGYVVQHPMIKIGDKFFNQEQGYFASVIVTVNLIFAFSGILFFKCLFLSLAVVILHATFRIHSAKASIVNWFTRVTGKEQLEDLFTPNEDDDEILPRTSRARTGSKSNMQESIYSSPTKNGELRSRHLPYREQ
ncbi:hypothetical protein CAOG_04503 [Capsaspora owczarzaki ATCC 30864]|uniref:PRA1 family protein n=1 Tax=Capsaspora owczarzaki (strain ATCC 30864) TaxID=595528 RepID=A0A0D2X362_CAPO3|nr:hypothetical protein CAOG_04503 [Capsaspora owczarzaki ATCC 30864]KJE93754.1 hypothetical protein CAOG_004503 [Capsaspora owczarzaki ATCC 30864]|eukprot:XP_004348331.1 hypothetical protein CAOG_04503 [Capsaspora owczarzaki ATCC 30864]